MLQFLFIAFLLLLPDSDEQSTSILIRQLFDSIVNAFGHKLISLCKENDLKILNGRLEPGRFTFMPKTGSSVVDHLITQTSNYSKILNMSINDPTEFSDHCVIEIIFAFKFQVKGENPKTFDKLSLDSSTCEELLHKLEDKRYLFEEISNSVSNDSIGQIDERIGSFTEQIFDTCFSVFGKTVTVGQTKPPDKLKKAPWFNTECRAAKDEFLKAKKAI